MYTLLDEPLSNSAIRQYLLANDGDCIKGVVAIELSDLIDNDLEGVLDLMSEKLTDTVLLTNIEYAVVGFDGETTLHMEVSGEVSQMDLEDDEPDEDEVA